MSEQTEKLNKSSEKGGDEFDRWDDFIIKGLKDPSGKALEIFMSEGVYSWFIRPWLSAEGAAEGTERIKRLAESVLQNHSLQKEAVCSVSYATDFPEGRSREQELLAEFTSNEENNRAALRLVFSGESIAEATKEVAAL